MVIEGIATRDPHVRPITLRRPRPGEAPEKPLAELVVLDESTGETFTLTDWRGESSPLLKYAKRDAVRCRIKRLDVFQGRYQAEVGEEIAAA